MDDEYTRLLAQVTEMKMVRRHLIRHLNTITKDGGSPRAFQDWNEVAAFRDTTERQRSAELLRCDADIESAFKLLTGEEAAGSVATVQADTIGSKLADRFRVVGFSLYSSEPYLFCFALDKSTAID